MRDVAFVTVAFLTIGLVAADLRAQGFGGSSSGGIGSSVGVGSGGGVLGSSGTGIGASNGIGSGALFGGSSNLFGNPLGVGASSDRLGSAGIPGSGNTGSGGGAAASSRTSATALATEQDHEPWRYRLQNGRWYYRTPNNKWLVWTGAHWIAAPAADTGSAMIASSARGQTGPVPYVTAYGSDASPGTNTGSAWVDPRAGALYGWGFGPGGAVMRSESGFQVGY